MPRFALLALAASLAACSTPASPAALDAGHPASVDASTTPDSAPLADLAPVPQPDLPTVLRPTPTMGMEGMDHDAMDREPMDQGKMDHGSMGHSMTPSGDEAAAPSPLADALDAYLAVHDALASDRLDTAAAARLAESFRRATEAGPSSDPHLWHRMDSEVTTAQAAADALRQAGTLDDARVAFGNLGVPFSALVAATGGDVVRHTCGMTDAPEGGVWLQHAGPVRNPYFGTAMLMCSRSSEPLHSTHPSR